jgi:hypothetical protein
MAVRTIRTETQGGGRIRVSTRHEYYETQKGKEKQKAAEKARKEESVKKIAGIAVDDKIFKDYEKKMYDVPGEKAMPFGTIELFANSDDVAGADPELHKKCVAIVEQVRSEVATLQRQQNGLSFKPKHDSFSGYIEDLQKLYSSAAAEREELKQKHKKEVESLKELEKTGATELERTRAKARRLEAEENYKDQLAELQSRTNKSIAEIREHFSDHVSEFYSPSGANLDAETVSLLQSGLKLRESEMNALFEKFRGNVTMLRLLGDYAEEHKIESKEARVLYTRAMSGGSHETSTFDTVVDMIKKAVSSDETTSKVWGSGSGHFDRLSNEAIQDLSNVIVKPE